jgi:hypothetical protein
MYSHHSIVICLYWYKRSAVLASLATISLVTLDLSLNVTAIEAGWSHVLINGVSLAANLLSACFAERCVWLRLIFAVQALCGASIVWHLGTLGKAPCLAPAFYTSEYILVSAIGAQIGLLFSEQGGHHVHSGVNDHQATEMSPIEGTSDRGDKVKKQTNIDPEKISIVGARSHISHV